MYDLSWKKTLRKKNVFFIQESTFSSSVEHIIPELGPPCHTHTCEDQLCGLPICLPLSLSVVTNPSYSGQTGPLLYFPRTVYHTSFPCAVGPQSVCQAGKSRLWDVSLQCKWYTALYCMLMIDDDDEVQERREI